MVMKRRSFLQAVGGAIAAVFVPVVAAEQVKRLAVFPAPRLAMSLQEYNRVRPRFIFEPETVAELRAAIEAAYKSVRPADPPMEEVFVHPLGVTSRGAAVDFPPGPIVKFSALRIIGDGHNEREAVLSAFNSIKEEIGGEELIWRNSLEVFDANDFSSNRRWVSVRGRAMVR